MKAWLQRQKYRILAGFVILTSFGFYFSLINISNSNQILKADAAEIKSIKYGLFNINEWKNQLYLIISDRINNLDIKGSKKNLKPIVEDQLKKLIDVVDQKVKNKNSKTVSGKLKQAFINTLVDINEIKKGVPQYADEIIRVMEKDKVKKKMQTVLQNKVESYFDDTYQDEDLSKIRAVLARVGAKDIDEARILLDEKIKTNNQVISILTLAFIIFSALFFFLISYFSQSLTPVLFFTLAAILTFLLIAGVSMPMIDLEAKISEMSFVLLNHPVKFTDQVIYFQSKSVVDVFRIMMAHPKLQMNIVGLLIVMFSVVFPILKLISAVAYYFDFRGSKMNKLIQFFVLKSGKWSMTDVMIIAIFMAYIGFNGIVSSQLDKLSSESESLMLLTTNGTDLQAGFYLFFEYALLALVFSELLVHNESTFREEEKATRSEVSFANA